MTDFWFSREHWLELLLMQEFDVDVSEWFYLQGFKKGHRLNK